MSEDQGSNSGYSFLAIVIAAGLIGFAIDKFVGSQPWGMLGFLVIGIVYATYKAQLAMQSPIVPPVIPLEPDTQDKKEVEKE